MTIVDRFDVFLFDLDGVIRLGGEALPGAVEAVERLDEMGKEIRFLTNDPRPRRRTVLEQLDVADPTSPDARHCLDAYFDELDGRFGNGFDPDHSISADADELTEPDGLFLLARLRGEPVGCGALKFHDPRPAEIKRMWVDPSARGLGLGRRILAGLEEQARRHGVTTVRLETNHRLTEAIHLYRSAGYREVEPFNDEPYAHHWFEKRLDPEPGGGS